MGGNKLCRRQLWEHMGERRGGEDYAVAEGSQMKKGPDHAKGYSRQPSKAHRATKSRVYQGAWPTHHEGTGRTCRPRGTGVWTLCHPRQHS